jgi:hypothetical protein
MKVNTAYLLVEGSSVSPYKIGVIRSIRILDIETYFGGLR